VPGAAPSRNFALWAKGPFRPLPAAARACGEGRVREVPGLAQGGCASVGLCLGRRATPPLLNLSLPARDCRMRQGWGELSFRRERLAKDRPAFFSYQPAAAGRDWSKRQVGLAAAFSLAPDESKQPSLFWVDKTGFVE
jgi:hypothetical protein